MSADCQGDTLTSSIILAGGRSSRMGSDKALLPLPGHEQTSFVEHLVSIVAPMGSEVLLVVRDETQALAYASLRNGDVRIVIDQIPDYGPLMGLYSGLSAMQTTSMYALVIAVDMPFAQPALLSYLLSQAQGDSMLVPVVEDTPQVLLAVYPRTILPTIEALLRQGRRDLRSLLKTAPVRYVDEAQLRTVDPQLRSFINVNTPDELHAIDPL